ncbi:MAG TPA: ATP-grasp domain-containing protein [Myxococcales bacterium]|jgi:D-alanine-D-alanine ligase
MHIAILYNHDFAHLPEGVTRNSQDAVVGVVHAFEQVLTARGASVSTFPAGQDPFSFPRDFVAGKPDLVINLCESFAGDARGEIIVPTLLDLLGVPYTGSGALTLLLALHKHKAKEILQARGIPTPAWHLVERPEDLAAVNLPFPVIVKPAHEDASIGIDRRSLAQDAAQLAWACQRVLTERQQPALVERFVDGRELNVAVLGPDGAAELQVLPINEIDFSGLAADHPRIVTYAAKWDEAAPEFKGTPPVRSQLPAETLERVSGVARAAFRALELRDYGRIDIRLSSDGTPYVIEVNPNCDLSADAGFAKAARAAGMDYEALVWRLVEIARSRHARPTASRG